MKIIFFFTYNRSFLRDFFVSLCEKLQEAGYEVVIYSFKSKPDEFQLQNGIRVKILKKKSKLFDYPRVLKIIRSEKPDVVVANFSYVNPAVVAARILGVKHSVVWFHTLIRQMNFSKRKVFLKSKILNWATEIITNSKELKNEVQTAYHQPESKIYNLPFTTSILQVNPKEFKFIKKTDKTYIGCPGRISVDKNQTILLDMAQQWNRDDVVFVFAGSVKENVIEDHPEYHQLKNQIIYLGVLTQSEMAQFYKEMDVIVLPSLNEAFGLVCIESLALGRPTFVSHRFGALDYIKQAYDAYIFDPENPAELADKIEKHLNSPPSESYFKNIYEANFSLEEVTKQFENILNSK